MATLARDGIAADVEPRDSSARRWGARILSAVPVLFLLLDAVMKLAAARVVLDTMPKLGYPASLARTLGVILIIPLVLYVIPRTAVLGAILLTGYLGGAVATHLRVGSPLLSDMLFPVYVGVMLWGGLYLRDARVRELIPLRRSA